MLKFSRLVLSPWTGFWAALAVFAICLVIAGVLNTSRGQGIGAGAGSDDVLSRQGLGHTAVPSGCLLASVGSCLLAQTGSKLLVR